MFMKKIFKILPMVALGAVLFACTARNTPSEDTGSAGDSQETDIDGDDVDGKAWSDTMYIAWSGSSAVVTGTIDSVSVTNSNGYVTVSSSSGRRIVYMLSGNGVGQLTIYGSYQHNLTLSGLTLACSDGPAINNQCHKKCYVVVNGSNTLSDGATYAESDEDRKAALFSEGQLIFSGSGTLAVTGNYKHAIASDDYIHLTDNAGTFTLSAASDGLHANDGVYIKGGTLTVNAGNDGVQCDSVILISGGTMDITAGDKGIVDSLGITVSGGTVRVTSQYKCIKTKADLLVSGGDIQVVCTGISSGGGKGWGGNSSSSSSPEGIEAKGSITISGGTVYSQSSDDAINAGGDLVISGGSVCAYSTGNDGLDANGDCYIKGGVVYAIGAGSPEVGIDANSEGGKRLYVQGGILVTLGGLESGAELSQSCWTAGSWSKNTWYGLTVGSDVFAFLTPSSGGSGMVVSCASEPVLMAGVTANGTAVFNGMGYFPASFSGGSDVTVSSYSGGNQDGFGGFGGDQGGNQGGNPGGGGRGGRGRM